jgi:transcriptional regulator with XRE-family HTH domain
MRLVARATLPLMTRQELLAMAIRVAMDDIGERPETLGPVVGESPRTVARWRAGTAVPDVLQVRPLADRLGVSPLLFVDPPEPPSYPLEAYRLSPEEAASAAARLAQRETEQAAGDDPPAGGTPSASPRRRPEPALR